MSALPWVGDSDAMALANLCQLADLRAALQADIATTGVVYESRGRRFTHPSVTALNEATKQMTAGLASFGLTPSDRSKLGVGERKAQSKFELLQMQRRQTDPPAS